MSATNQKTNCPYCGTANLVKNQLLYIDKYGTHIFICHLCKNVFSDLSIQSSEQDVEKIITNIQKQEKNG